MLKWLALLVTLLVAGWLGFVTSQPPAPLPASAPADMFSAERAMADVRAVATVPHSTGSPENVAAVGYLVRRLEALGFTVRTSTSPLPQKGRDRLKDWGSPHYLDTQLTNIVAVRPGRDSAAPAVMMMAHHDSVWASPGAADDGAGVAAALEIARAIPREAQARDLVILLTDAEELGLFGAKAFFAPAPGGDPLAGRIGAIVNMETRGGGGRAYMFETGPDAGRMVELYQRAVTQPATTSMAVKLYQMLPNSTDYTAALNLGIPGFNLAFTGRAGLYHSPLATPDNLEVGALQHLGAQGLELTRALVTAPQLPAAAPDVVFGDVFGAFTFAWPPLVGWGLVAMAALLIGVAARDRRSEWRWRGVFGGVLDGLGVAAAAAALLYFGNLLSGADGETNYYDRLAALPRLEVQALLLFGAGLAVALALLPRRRTLWDGWIGLALLSLVLAAAVQALLPAGGAIFQLPLLLAVTAMVVASRVPVLATPAAMLAAIPALAWLGGLAHNIMLGIGAGMPSVAAIFAPLALLLLWPLLPRVSRKAAAVVALLLVVGAGGIALWVRLDPVAVSVPPYPSRK
jgi:Peptidase family M28